MRAFSQNTLIVIVVIDIDVVVDFDIVVVVVVVVGNDDGHKAFSFFAR